MSDLFERYIPSWSSDSVRIYNTPSQTARNIYFYIQECGYFKTKPPYYTERENLNSYLIIYTLNGCGTLYYNDSEYTLEKNKLCYIDCTKHHKYECIPNSDWEFLWLHFNGICAPGYYTEFLKNEFSVIDTGIQTENRIRRIIALTKNKQNDSEIIISSLISEILTDVVLSNRHSSQEHIYIPSYIKDSLRYIEQSYSKNITAKSIALNAGFSNEHFTREFKKYVGMTVREYIIEKRMNAAKELLQQTELSIEEIAYTIGMGGASRFIELFRKRELITPLTYRRKWRKNI